MNTNKQLLSICPKKKIYVVNKIFLSPQIQYKKLIIKPNKDNESIILVDLDYELSDSDKLLCITLITENDYIIIGFENDDRVHLVYTEQIAKLHPTSLLIGYHIDIGCNYNEKLVLPNLSYDTFQIIIESFDNPQILMTKKNAKILDYADTYGLINPILYYKNNVLEKHYQQKKMEDMNSFSQFINSKTDKYFCHAIDEYLYYKNIFRNDCAIMPVQFVVYVNMEAKYIISVSIYDGITIKFGKTDPFKHSTRRNQATSYFSDPVIDINQYRHKILFDNTSSWHDAMILNIPKPIAIGKATAKKQQQSKPPPTISTNIITDRNQILNMCVENMKSVLDETDRTNVELFKTFKIYNKIIEANCDPNLIYGSNEIDFCTGICTLYGDMCCNTYLDKNNLISTEKFKTMDTARQQKYLYNLNEHNLNESNIKTHLHEVKTKITNMMKYNDCRFIKKQLYVEKTIVKHKYPRKFRSVDVLNLNNRDYIYSRNRYGSSGSEESEESEETISDNEKNFASVLNINNVNAEKDIKYSEEISKFRMYFGFVRLH